MKAVQGRRSLPVHEVRAVVVVHGLRLVQPDGTCAQISESRAFDKMIYAQDRTLEAMALLRRLMTRVDHTIIVIIVVPELLRDGQRFAHRHDGQLASRQ